MVRQSGRRWEPQERRPKSRCEVEIQNWKPFALPEQDILTVIH